MGDATVILTKLDKVAPDDIEPDVAAVLQSWKDVQGTLGDEASNALNPTGLIGTVLKGLLASAESSGSWQRVGNYVEETASPTNDLPGPPAAAARTAGIRSATATARSSRINELPA